MYCCVRRARSTKKGPADRAWMAVYTVLYGTLGVRNLFTLTIRTFRVNSREIIKCTAWAWISADCDLNTNVTDMCMCSGAGNGGPFSVHLFQWQSIASIFVNVETGRRIGRTICCTRGLIVIRNPIELLANRRLEFSTFTRRSIGRPDVFRTGTFRFIFHEYI